MPTLSYTLLIASASMAVAGSAHCATMCGGLSAAAHTRSNSFAVFLLLRIVSYACVGAAIGLFGAGLYALTSFQGAVAAFAWMVQMACAAIAVWMMLTGRNPFERWARSSRLPAGLQPVRWSGARGAGWGTAPLGIFWGFMPCGLLWGGYGLALVSGSWLGGALVMAVFAGVSSLAIGAGRIAVMHLAKAGSLSWAMRFSGLLIAAQLGWVWYHIRSMRPYDIIQWCVS